MTLNSKDAALKIAQILEDKKAEDVIILDIHKLTVIADFFVIGSGGSEPQVRALYEEIEEKMKAEGLEPRHWEGRKNDRWVVLDYGDIIVHVFHREEREFYGLERLWADGISISVDNP